MAQAGQPLDALIGQVSSSKFQIRRLLGAGGMGAVYEAEHLFTKRIGALKLLHEQFAQVPEIVERFTREASAAGRIENPHIVETYDAGRLESGHPYMFMELLSGKPLDDVLRERGPLAFPEAIAICAQAAAGLCAAHRAGIIHRDIKPANLFLVDGANTLVKLLDFGISKFALPNEVSRVTQEGATLGTPYYMPPEQVMGKTDIDEGVDIYALGIVLYETVIGTPPYVADTLPALSVRIYEGRYTEVSQLRPDTPLGFDAVIASCLAVQREQRYPRMQDLLADLLRLSGHHAESLAPTLVAGSQLPLEERGSFRPSVPAVSSPQRIAPGRARESAPSPSLPAPAKARGRLGLAVLLALAGVAGLASFALSTREEDSPPSAVQGLQSTDASSNSMLSAPGAPGAASGAVAPGLTSVSVSPIGNPDSPDPQGSARAQLGGAARHEETSGVHSGEHTSPAPSASPRASIEAPPAVTGGSKTTGRPGGVSADRDGLKRENPFE